MFVTVFVIVLLGVLAIALMPGGKPTAIRDAARGETLPEAVLPDGETILITPTAVTADAQGVSPPG